MQEEVKEGENFPSPTAPRFLYEAAEGLTVARGSATCGPEEILERATAPADTYEWKFVGVKTTADATLFGGEIGMISVITDNYRALDCRWRICDLRAEGDPRKSNGAGGHLRVGIFTSFHHEAATIIFFSDRYMDEDLRESANFPSLTATKFSYKAAEGFTVACGSATCRPEEICRRDGAPTDTYEWEFVGVKTAADAALFGGELGMISVITDNYRVLDFNSLDSTNFHHEVFHQGDLWRKITISIFMTLE